MVHFADVPRVAVRPPEYLPGLAYMALAAAVDTFVLADTFQYSNKSFQNRAKLRSPQGWHWISVPLHGKQHGRPIREVEIENKRKWTRSHRRSFEYNYRSTPYFEYYEERFVPLFEKQWKRLGALTCASVELLHGLLELDSRLVRASALAGEPTSVPAVLDALEASGQAMLLAPPSAADHDADLVQEAGAFRYEAPSYHQNFAGFEPGMSTADMLFNYGPDTAAMLRDHASVTPAGEPAPTGDT